MNFSEMTVDKDEIISTEFTFLINPPSLFKPADNIAFCVYDYVHMKTQCNNGGFSCVKLGFV